MILVTAIVGALVWAAEFRSKPLRGRERFLDELERRSALILEVDSLEDLVEEMAIMTQETFWYPTETRWLGLKASDYPECSEYREVREFFLYSAEAYGPMMIRDLVRYADSIENWQTIFSNYFQKYRLRQIREVNEDLAEAVEDASTTSLDGKVGCLLSNLLIPNSHVLPPPRSYPVFDYHSAKISCLFHLCHYSSLSIYQHVFNNQINLVEQLVVLNELDVEYDLNLDAWIQTQPHRMQFLLQAIRGDMSIDLMDYLMPRDLLKAFKRMRSINLEIDDFGLSLLAFILQHWSPGLVLRRFPLISTVSAVNLMWRSPHLKLFSDHIVFIALTTLLWKYPVVLWKHPNLIHQLPKEMPPISSLIPKSARISIHHSFVFKTISNRYGFEAAERAMRAEGYSDDMIFYLYLSNSMTSPNLRVPTDLSESEAEEWLHLLH